MDTAEVRIAPEEAPARQDTNVSLPQEGGAARQQDQRPTAATPDAQGGAGAARISEWGRESGTLEVKVGGQ